MSESSLRKTLLGVALLGLIAGILAYVASEPAFADPIWTVATVPVIAALAISMIRDLWIGRLGVDAIAFVSMSAALLLSQPLAAIVVAIMYAGGNVLEDFARGRAQRSLKALTDRTPRSARLRSGERFVEVPVEQVAVGDMLLVGAGEMLPVDGVLVDRSASIDESAVTGEPLARQLGTGDALRSGTVNAGEAFHFRASALASESTYAGIVRMVEAAQTAKAPFMRMADRFALFLLPATLIAAGAAWYASGDPLRALAVLVVATPCPLILAAPVAFIGGVSRAARAGVLLKGSSAIEALAGIRTAIFDKTGTLTEGGATLLAIETASHAAPDESLRQLASLEQASRHVVADAVLREARGRGLSLSQPRDVKEFRGSGLEGMVDAVRIRAGSRNLICAGQPLPFWANGLVDRFQGQAVLTVFLETDNRLAAVLVFGDAARPDARQTIDDLRAAGVSRIVMVTGDDRATATSVGAELGLDLIVADRNPGEKLAEVAAERARAPTMMVGDGINDAPALAAATVGVAMGARGATASSEAADVVILTDRLHPVAEVVLIAQRTRAIALQSVIAGLALSGIAMVAAALGYLPPVAGALLQEAIDVAVILNALRSLGEGRREGRNRLASSKAAQAIALG